MKKIFALAVIAGTMCLQANATPIVELAAPRARTSSDFIFNEAPQKTKKVTQKVVIKKNKKTGKQIKKVVKQTVEVPVAVDYNKILKMVEYGYYDSANDILNSEIKKNPKNIKALALKTVNMAKQNKLDAAQESIDKLLKTYPNNSDLHYAQGLVHYQRTNSSNMKYRANMDELLDSALNEFKLAIKYDSNNARAYNAAGVIELVKGNNEEAKKYFDTSVAKDKAYAAAIDNSGTIDFINGEYESAEKKFTSALHYNTKSTIAMYHLAQCKMQQKDYTGAITYLNNAMALSPNSPAILNLLGKAYKEQGNEAAALNCFKKSTMAKPEFSLSYLDTADIYAKRGDFEFAIEQLKTADSINDTNYDAKLKIADLSYANANYNQAITYYNKLVAVDEYKTPALKGLANSYYAQAKFYAANSSIASNKEIAKAVKAINSAIASDNKDLELYLAKLKLMKLANNEEKANAVTDEILSTEANDIISNLVKGEVYLTNYDVVNAKKCFDEAIVLSDNIDEDSYLAEIFTYNRHFDEAQKVLNDILKENPDDADAAANIDYIQKCKKYADNFYKSALAFKKAKNVTTAKEYLSRSLSLNPDNPAAYLLFAELCEQTGENLEALKNYKTYVGYANAQPNAKKIDKKIEKKIKNLEARL